MSMPRYYMWTPWVLIPAALAYLLVRSYWSGVESGFVGSVVKSFQKVTENGGLRGSEEDQRINKATVKELRVVIQ